MDHKFPINPSWPRKKVTSSQISEIAYDPLGERLFVLFSNDTLYTYEPVKRKKYDEFADSPSVGSYFHKHFKNKPKIKTSKI
jgi:hypothetical protein